MSVHEKLMEIQHKLKAPKGQYNKFGNYSYRSCEDILEAVKPLLYENKLVLKISDEPKLVGERVYIEATATLIDIEDGSTDTSKASAKESLVGKNGMSDEQVTGSASSYARKYALNGLFCIDDTKDPDATNTHNKAEQKPTQTQKTNLTQPQIQRLYAIAYSKGVDKETVKQQVFKRFKKEPKDLTKQEYDRVVAGYENMA